MFEFLIPPRPRRAFVPIAVCMCLCGRYSLAQEVSTPARCPSRPAVGSEMMQPESLRSVGGVLRADFSYRSDIDSAGARRYCYVAPDGGEAPTLRVHPGDLLILRLTNDV